jgi:nicotinate-nucleotide pyrophosphorylase (carboxylating)
LRRVLRPLDWQAVDPVIDRALAEDLGTGDVTTELTVPAGLRGEGRLLAREEGVSAGLPLVRRLFERLDPSVRFEGFLEDGAPFTAGQTLGVVLGEVRTLLRGERTALNFLQRLSGIATLTRAFVRALEGTGAVVLDTRKTTPGLRALEKYAVTAGGGVNHRFGLFDEVLVKNNHADAAGGVTPALERCYEGMRERGIRFKVVVEARDLDEVREALAFPVDRILLDNMAPEAMHRAAALARGRVDLEASGGVRLDTAAAVARTGVRFVSVGALTHSARALDLSFHVRPLHPEVTHD